MIYLNWNREANTYKTEWREVMFKMDKDIAEYLERRYEDYCRDRSEKSSVSGGYNQLEGCNVKQNQLIKFGIKLKKKLSFFLHKSRKDLFEQALENLELVDKFYKNKYDEFCKELEEANRKLPLHKQRASYTLHVDRKEKEEHFFNQKERLKDYTFVRNIDKKRADYEKKKADREKRRIEEEKRKVEEKIKEERIERRKGFSNVKPLSFYEEMYIRDDSPFSYGDIDDDKEHIRSEEVFDIYFEENGSPKGIRNERGYWCGDLSISDKRPGEYTSADTPEENQKNIDRCKEITNILINLSDSESNQRYLRHTEILQRYLTEGYLITRQIAWFVYYINAMLIEVLSIDPNNPNRYIKDHPSKEYDVGIYKDNFNITKIKEDVDEFIRINEGMILTPIEYLKVFLKKHDNRIPVVRYASIINKSEKVAMRILKGFVADKKLKSKKTGSSHKLIFYV